MPLRGKRIGFALGVARKTSTARPVKGVTLGFLR